jgi:hypothetical protein
MKVVNYNVIALSPTWGDINHRSAEIVLFVTKNHTFAELFLA